MLKPCMQPGRLECGVDEAGRGCLAGAVFAAAVILPADFDCPLLNDSKKLSAKQRYNLRPYIEQHAVAWAVATATPEEIDRLNILWASVTAMNRAIGQLKQKPDFLLIDGNRFKNQTDIPYQTVVKGDATYQSIAAASILAKTYRDDYMRQIAIEYPHYAWDINMGYPTRAHYEGIRQNGISPYHRKTFNLFKNP